MTFTYVTKYILQMWNREIHAYSSEKGKEIAELSDETFVVHRFYSTSRAESSHPPLASGAFPVRWTLNADTVDEYRPLLPTSK